MTDDLISRQAVLDIVDGYSESQSNVEDVTQDIISDIIILPSVNPQEPKMGHWIWKDFDDETGISKSYWCSECNKPLTGLAMDYCGCCGARMESEG